MREIIFEKKVTGTLKMRLIFRSSGCEIILILFFGKTHETTENKIRDIWKGGSA
jgi:hypothetical protein